MRKQIKKQLLQMLDTLRGVARAGEALEQLQAAVVQVGEALERELGAESAEIVSVLEQACEIIWQAAQAQGSAQKNEFLGQLEETLAAASDMLRKVQAKRVVAFFPYKASMWECMESVWRAACADEDSEVYVVPIPYFDLENGQVGERHYEGEIFPSYVKITDYRSFPLEQYRPDAAFIHNPFDRWNKVTSVLPQYYSDELKKWVGKLIYIPYFMSMDSVYVAHRFLPSYLNCDYIVVQNERMIASFAPSVPREKFLPLGSPIADRAFYLEEHKPPVPEEWRKMLPEGKSFETCRKVMLNTSISMLAQQGERFLNKIEAIFEEAKKHEGILLVWRPHPLLKISAKMQGERLERRLEELEQRFVQERLGVLDRTADIGIAVALCDAYLGEVSSSVVHMFGVTGKPRLFVNQVLPHADKIETQGTYYLECGDDQADYFLLEERGYLAKRERETGAIQLLAQIPEYICEGGNIYVSMQLEGGELVLRTADEKIILRYDLDKGSFCRTFYDLTQQETMGAAPERECPEGKTIELPRSAVARICVDRMLSCSANHTWEEGLNGEIEEYFYFMENAAEQELRGSAAAYAYWLNNMDGSAGEKIYQAVKEQLGE